MLGSIREKTKGTFAYVIVGFITIPFLLVGIGDYLLPTDDRGIYVGDNKISSTQIDAITKQKVQEIQRQTKMDNVDIEDEVRAMVEEELVQNEIVSIFRDENSALVNQERVVSEIQNMDVFHDNGRFSVGKYKTILRINDLTVSEYEKTVLDTLANEEVENVIYQPAPTKVNNLFSSIMNESKEVLLKPVDYDSKENPINPTEDEIDIYFSKNKDRYNTDKLISVRYFNLSDKNILDTIDITSQQIETAYNEYIANNEKAVTYTFIQDQHETKDEAESNLTYLKSLQNDTAEYKRLEMSVGYGELDNDMEKELFEMSEGDSKVFKSSFGWHSAVMVKVDRDENKPFEEMAKNLKDNLKLDQLSIKKNKVIDQINSTLYEEGIDVALSEFGYSASELTKINKKDLEWSKSTNQKIWDDAVKGNTGVAEDKDMAVFYEIDKVIYPREMTKIEAKDRVIEDLKSARIMEIKKANVDNILQNQDKTDWIKIIVNRDIQRKNKLSEEIFDRNKLTGWIDSSGEIYAYESTGVFKQNNAWDSNSFTAIVKGEKQQWFNMEKGKEYGIEKKK